MHLFLRQTKHLCMIVLLYVLIYGKCDESNISHSIDVIIRQGFNEFSFFEYEKDYFQNNYLSSEIYFSHYNTRFIYSISTTRIHEESQTSLNFWFISKTISFITHWSIQSTHFQFIFIVITVSVPLVEREHYKHYATNSEQQQ